MTPLENFAIFIDFVWQNINELISLLITQFLSMNVECLVQYNFIRIEHTSN